VTIDVDVDVHEKVNRFCGGKAEVVSLEAIRAEVAQCLHLDRLSFLIGAGCSSHIVDDVEKGIMGMWGLHEAFFEQYPDFEIAGVEARDLFDGNLEAMLGTINAVATVNGLTEVDASIEEKASLVRGFIRSRVIKGMSGEEVSSFYRRFFQGIVSQGRRAPINIFTTNYDLYVEQALDSLRFPYNNGFSGTYHRTFDPASYRYALVEDLRLSRDAWGRVPNYFNLYKLHGSVSWIRDEDDGVREVDYAGVTNDQTVMIYPTPLKDRSTLMTPYSDLFRSMENELLQSNSVLIVMGYSFGDEHINRLIYNALAVPTFRLVVFGSSKNINKLNELGDSRIVIINSEDKIYYFENLVDKVFPNASEELVEEMRVREVTRRLGKVLGLDSDDGIGDARDSARKAGEAYE